MSKSKHRNQKLYSYGIVGFIFGLTGLLAWIVPILGIIIGIIAVIFSSLAIPNLSAKRMASIGLILGILCIFASSINWTIGAAIFERIKNKSHTIESHSEPLQSSDSKLTSLKVLSPEEQQIETIIDSIETQKIKYGYSSETNRAYLKQCMNEVSKTVKDTTQIDDYCGCTLLNIRNNFSERKFAQIELEILETGVWPSELTEIAKYCTDNI